MSKYPQRACSGFTLIELLVTISMIALLIAILLPTLASARKAAQGAACLSNLRQLGIAVVMYESDHGYLPPRQMPSSWEGVSYKAGYPNWATVLRRRDYVTSPETDERYPVSGVFRCASHQQDELGADNTDPTRATMFSNHYYASYVINNWYVGYSPTSIPHRLQGITGIPASEIVVPSDTVILADGDYSHIHDQTRKFNVARRHAQASHLLMADGHVEAIREPFVNASSTEPLWGRGLRR